MSLCKCHLCKDKRRQVDKDEAPAGYVALEHVRMNCDACALDDSAKKCGKAKCHGFDRVDGRDVYFKLRGDEE